MSGLARQDLGPQLLEPVDAPGRQGQVVAEGGELAGHLGAEARSWRR